MKQPGCYRKSNQKYLKFLRTVILGLVLNLIQDWSRISPNRKNEMLKQVQDDTILCFKCRDKFSDFLCKNLTIQTWVDPAKGGTFRFCNDEDNRSDL